MRDARCSKSASYSHEATQRRAFALLPLPSGRAPFGTGTVSLFQITFFSCIVAVCCFFLRGCSFFLSSLRRTLVVPLPQEQ